MLLNPFDNTPFSRVVFKGVHKCHPILISKYFVQIIFLVVSFSFSLSGTGGK